METKQQKSVSVEKPQDTDSAMRIYRNILKNMAWKRGNRTAYGNAFSVLANRHKINEETAKELFYSKDARELFGYMVLNSTVSREDNQRLAQQLIELTTVQEEKLKGMDEGE